MGVPYCYLREMRPQCASCRSCLLWRNAHIGAGSGTESDASYDGPTLSALRLWLRG